MPRGEVQTLRVRGGVPGQVVAILYDFDTGASELQPAHRRWLDAHVVPLLRDGGGLYVQGWASPLGSEEDNLALSRRRADAAVRYLRQHADREFRYLRADGSGEGFAREAGVADGANPAFFRAVLVSASPQPAPPPPPPPPPPAEVRRVVFRRWREVVVQRLPTGDPMHPGEDDPWVRGGRALIEHVYTRLAGRQDDPVGVEQIDFRRHADVVETHRVNRIESVSRIRFESSLLGVNQEVVTEVTYRWGPPEEEVVLIRREIVDRSGIWGMSGPPRPGQTRTLRIPRAQAERSSFYHPVGLRGRPR